MIYTLNLFDIRPENIDLYRQYSREAGRVIAALGGQVICSGWHPKTLRGEMMRSFFIVVAFPSHEAFMTFLNDPQYKEMHTWRDASTENYIWKLFESWDLRHWVAFSGVR